MLSSRAHPSGSRKYSARETNFGTAVRPGEKLLKSLVRKFRIQQCKARLALCRITLTALERQFGNEAASDEHRAAIRSQWDETMRDRHAERLMLEKLERQEREERHHAGELSVN
jgi:hypothetical protein